MGIVTGDEKGTISSSREYTPRLLREISEDTEDAINAILQELHILFPSYRDDQLFTFWLGKLKENGIDISDFDSNVSFQENPKTYLTNVYVYLDHMQFEVFRGPRSFGYGDYWKDGSLGGSGIWCNYENMRAEVINLVKTEACLRKFEVKNPDLRIPEES